MEQSAADHSLDEGVSAETSAILSEKTSDRPAPTDLGDIPPSRDCPGGASSSPEKSGLVRVQIFATDPAKRVPVPTGEFVWFPVEKIPTKKSRQEILDEAVRQNLSGTFPGAVRMTARHVRRCGYCQAKFDAIRADYLRMSHVKR